MSANIYAGIIERYKRYGWTEPPGEWGYINADERQPYRDILEAGDEPALERLLGSMFRQSVTHGIISVNLASRRSPTFQDDLADATLDNLAFWASYTDGNKIDLARLRAPPHGKPWVTEVFDGSLIMTDTPRHDHYAQRIAKLLPDGGTVLEIGGGYGGMALQLLRARDNVQVVLCDLPETLYLAWWWLANAIDRTIAWYDDDPSADVVLLPAHEKEGWYGADVVFAAHSLSEMTLPVVEQYMAWWPKLCPRFYYIDQVQMMVRPVAGRVASRDRWPEVLTEQMVPGMPYRETFRAPTQWVMGAGRYWEHIYEREDV